MGAISWTVLGAHTELKDIRVPPGENGDTLFFKQGAQKDYDNDKTKLALRAKATLDLSYIQWKQSLKERK